MDIMKDIGECYLCREVFICFFFFFNIKNLIFFFFSIQAIKEILRLDIKDKKSNNFKVIELTTLVDETIVEKEDKD